MTGTRFGRRQRGQPLAVLGAMLLGWISLRAALWEQIELPGLPPPISQAVARILPKTVSKAEPVPVSNLAVRPRSIAMPIAPASLFAAGSPGPARAAEPVPLPEFSAPQGSLDGPRVAAAHQLAWMAGVAQLPMPRFVLESLQQGQHRAGAFFPAPSPATSAPVAARTTGRWSVEGWLLLRSGGAGPTAAGLPSPTYGASQAGAVLRYRLSASGAQRAALFLRASSAVHGPRGEEAALGIAARPLASLPVALQAEVRATRFASGVALRPAVAAITELPRIALRGGLSAEAYGQVGLIGGADSTAFVDGQLRVEQRLVRWGRGELRVGLGSWGGAQKGASRLDVGPTATLDFAIGGGQGRVSADWRLRAVGNAAPQSGPAITLSAGF